VLLTKCYYGIKYRRMRLAGHVAYLGKKINAYRNLMRKPEERTSVRGWHT
jgi:hypothetical protein